MGLIEMFKELVENKMDTNYVKYTDVTWLLVNVSLNLNLIVYLISELLKKTTKLM